MLHKAARTGVKSSIELLLNYGANPNAVDLNGETALMYLCRHNHDIQLILLLLRYSADPDIENHSGEKARDLSRQHKSNDKIEKVLHPILRQF